MPELYLSALDVAYFEVTEAFRGMADENVWKRPAPGLLSVGELAAHHVYWEAVRLAGAGSDAFGKPDLATCPVHSVLIDSRFSYYPVTLANPPSEAHLAMNAEHLCTEMLRLHEEAVAHFRGLNPDLDITPPGWPPEWTYRKFLQYLSFHLAYHTGQMYTVRHLLGEETPDN